MRGKGVSDIVQPFDKLFSEVYWAIDRPLY